MARRKGDEFLSNADDVVISCRALGHVWVEESDYFEGQQVWLVMQCTRCESYRVQEWARNTGTVEGRKYYYSPGYVNTTGQSFSRAELRKERIKRTTFQGGSQEFEQALERIAQTMEKYYGQ